VSFAVPAKSARGLAHSKTLRAVLCLPLFWRVRDAVADFSQQLPAAGRVAAPAARKIVFGPHLPAG